MKEDDGISSIWFNQLTIDFFFKTYLILDFTYLLRNISDDNTLFLYCHFSFLPLRVSRSNIILWTPLSTHFHSHRTWHGMVWLGKSYIVCHGMVWYGMVWCDTVW